MLPTINYDELQKRPRLYKEFSENIRNKRIFYVSGHTGFGKTCAVLDWLRGSKKSFAYASASDEDFFDQISDSSFSEKKLVVLDDLSCIEDQDDKIRLYNYINESTKTFVLIGRQRMPSFLKAFFVSGQMDVCDWMKMRFSILETKDLFAADNIILSDREAEEITSATYGNVRYLVFVRHRYDDGGFNQVVLEQAKQDYFDYMDYSVYQNLSEVNRIALMELAVMEEFEPELAVMLTGNNDIIEQLKAIGDFDNIIKILPNGKYTFAYPEMREYILRNQKRHFSSESIAQLLQKVGLYYELQGNLCEAMKYYKQGGNKDKVYALLIENTRRSAANARFYDTEEYYNSLPVDMVRESPELMCGMSMLQSLCFRPEESERWYEELKAFMQRIDHKDARYKVARNKLVYLDIGLPHRGITGIADILENIYKLLNSQKIAIQETSATGDMPSVIAGGKDFSSWTPRDKTMYTLLKVPTEKILGKFVVGYWDIGVGESLYEKSPVLNFTEPLSYLNRALSDITSGGSLQMEFAALGVMSRIFASSGSIDSAISLISNFRDKASENGGTILLENIEAWCLELRLMAGDSEAAASWMMEKAPDEMRHFYILRRLGYLIKVRIYAMEGRYTEALSLLERLKNYFERYNRTYNLNQAKLLAAAIRFRNNDDSWTEELEEVLRWCEGYHFYRIIADEGIFVLEMLNHYSYEGDKKYYKTLRSLTRVQAANYPHYLEKKEQACDTLTETEKSVMKLMMQGLKNEEIAEILGITLRTVKYHAGNIYSKLNVKNRTAAILKMKRLEN